MTVKLDELLQKNQELMDEIQTINRKAFLGPRAITRLVSKLLTIVPMYHHLCMALMGMGAHDDKSIDSADGREDPSNDD